MKNKRHVIVVHGGAGTWKPEFSRHGLDGVKKAARTGFEVLEQDGPATDSVMEAVACMEDSGVFNAGYGSSLNILRLPEMEASIMDGRTLNAGAVGLLSDIRNPVRLARIIMEKTDHVFVVGPGAEKLASIYHLERRGSISERRLRQYEDQIRILNEGKAQLPKLAALINEHPEVFKFGTVGAVALDKSGDVAAATSTGGSPLKLPGRVGDSPLIGCGTYADNQCGACSATGVGEIAIRLVLAKTVCNLLHEGKTAQEAAEIAIDLVNQRIPDTYNSMGLISIDTSGRIGAAHNSPNLCWAYIETPRKKPVASLDAKLIKQYP